MFAFRPRNLIYKFLSQPYSLCLGLREKSQDFIFFPFPPHTLLACLLGNKNTACILSEKKKSFFATLKCGFLKTQYWKFNVNSISSPDDREFKKYTAPICVCNWQNVISSVPTKEMKDLNINLYFLKWKIFCAAPINRQKMKNWSFPVFYSAFSFFFLLVKEYCENKMRTSEADLQVLKVLLSLIHLVRGSKKKEKHSFSCVNALSEGRGPFLHLFFWVFMLLWENSGQRERVLPKFSGTKGYRGTRFKSRLC